MGREVLIALSSGLSALFVFGYSTALWGAYEIAYDAGTPLWSGTFGPPWLHHYLVGFILAGVSFIGIMVVLLYLLLQKEKKRRKKLVWLNLD